MSLALAQWRVTALDVLVDQRAELRHDVFTTQGNGTFAIDIYRRDRRFASARQRNTDIRVLAFAGTIHHATHHRQRHVFNA